MLADPNISGMRGIGDIGARVYNSVSLTIPNATATLLTFDSERWDTDNIHDLVTNNERLTCRTTGKYFISVNIRWNANATGYRDVRIRVNGGPIIAFIREAIVGVNSPIQSVSTVYSLSVGDWMEVQVFQNRGDSLDIQSAARYSPEFMMQQIG